MLVIPVIVNGKPGSGKTTMGKIWSTQFKAVHISTVDKIKEAARLLGWDGSKKPRDRNLLHELKKLSLVYDHPMNYVKEVIFFYQSLVTPSHEVMYILIDSREPEEIIRFKKELLNCITVFVDRDVEGFKGNSSDANVDNYEYDFIINNNGNIENLIREIFDVVDKIEKRR